VTQLLTDQNTQGGPKVKSTVYVVMELVKNYEYGDNAVNLIGNSNSGIKQEMC
jgi:hypothetical protein